MSDSESDIEIGSPKGAEGNELNDNAGDKQVAISNSEEQNSDMETKRDGKTMSEHESEFNIDTLVRKRERRKPHLGLKAQESRTYMLSSELTKSVSGIYRFLRSSQQGLANDISLGTLYDMHDAIGDQMKSIVGKYTELETLYSEQKSTMPEEIRSKYTQLITQVGLFRTNLDKRIDFLEEEAQKEEQKHEENMRNIDNEIQENARIFQEMMNESRDTSYSAGPRPELETQPTSQDNRTLDASGYEEKSYKTERRISNVDHQPDVMGKLADVLSSVIRQTTVEPVVFTGDFLQFKDWEVDLDLYLRNERIEGKERLRFLKKFIDGEAKTAIEGHLMSHTDQAYIAARKLLKDRYGNEHVIARSFRDRLNRWPNVFSDDGKALLEYSDFLGHLLTAKSSILALNVLDDYSENERMCNKLPARLKWKWARKVSKIQENEHRYPGFQEFCNFVQDEAKIGQLPLAQGFSAKGRSSERPSRPPGHLRNAFSTTAEKGCLYCQLTDHEAS